MSSSGPRTANVEAALVDEVWAGLAGGTDRPDATLAGRSDALASALRCPEAAVATVTVAIGAAAALTRHRTGRCPTIALDRAHIADAVRSERFFRVDGQPAGAGFAPLSRFWAAADGHVRSHGNYPWHAAALRRALDLPGRAAIADVASAVGQLRAADVEQRIVAAGGVAAAVRTTDDWAAHPQGRAVRAEPLVSCEETGPAAARARPAAGLPAEGVRVLDLTRVIAGPVCTRMLGALGADVLRLDPTGLDDVPPGSYADTLLGKRSAVLDLAADGDRLHMLLDRADVVVCGYRPGSLERHGLGDDDLATRHPGLVVVRLAAWGHTGPWGGRRGFDSVVQAGTGIADAEGDGAQPGTLPCQLLDHGTGYLAAAAVLDGLRRQTDTGGSIVRRVSLARTASWLLAAPRPDSVPRILPEAPTTSRLVDVGAISAVAPPGRLDGQALRWPTPSRFQQDIPCWA